MSSDSLWAEAGKGAAWAAALVGSITLAQVQEVLGLASTLLVGTLAAVNLYTAIRRKQWKAPPRLLDEEGGP